VVAGRRRCRAAAWAGWISNSTSQQTENGKAARKSGLFLCRSAPKPVSSFRARAKPANPESSYNEKYTSFICLPAAERKSAEVPGFSSQYGVKQLVWFETHDNAPTAIEREKEIKKWRREWTIALIEKENAEWRDLYDEITR
jgi:putative endonuclease